MSKKPVWCAWAIGTVINISGIAISYKFDLPTGYTLVFFHTTFAVMSSLLWREKEGYHGD
jgi:ABC-type Mn2+/Zn2+ transport system permease subunit